jgi:hypothetical protein
MFKFVFLHGEGHKHYKSNTAKQKYADQLIRLSEKCFLAIIAPAFSLPMSDNPDAFFISTAMAVVFFVGGLYFRHEGLLIYDKWAKVEHDEEI